MQLSAQEITTIVCDEYNCSEIEVRSLVRRWNIIDARQTIIYLRMLFLKESSPKLANDYHISHPAVLHSRKAVINKIDGIRTNKGTVYSYKPFKVHFDNIISKIADQMDFDYNSLLNG